MSTDNAQAVVEYTADQAVQQLRAKPLSTRLTRSFDAEAKDAAIGAIERYMPVGQNGVSGFHMVDDIDSMAERFARTAPQWTVDQIRTSVQAKLLGYATNRQAPIGGKVQLDIEGQSWEVEAFVEPGVYSDEAIELAMQPVVMFFDLPQSSPLFVAGEREAAAIVFIPSSVYPSVWNRNDGSTQIVLKPSYRDYIPDGEDGRPDYGAAILAAPGVLGIARYFRHSVEMGREIAGLKAALRTYHQQCRLESGAVQPLTGADRELAMQARREVGPRPDDFV